MKSFSKISNIKRINEQEEEEMVKANLPENIPAPDTEKSGNYSLGAVKPEHIEKEEKEESPKSNVSSFFSKIFESKEMARVYHLQVNGDMGSHATHEAMGSYYEQLPEFIDDLVEIYQGQYEIVKDYDVIDTKETGTKTPIDYFTSIADFLKKERSCISSEDTHLHNIIDEIVALVYKTLYRLKYNK
jgi:hypothetical protein